MDVLANGDIRFYEQTGTTPKFYWDASAERLGLGTPSPTTALDVTGTVTADDVQSTLFGAADGSEANPSIRNIGDSNTGFWFPAADTIGVSTGGNERLRITSAGSVGIGTSSFTSANSKLQVTGSGITTSDTTTALANKNSRYFGVSQVDQEVTMTYLAASATNNTLIVGGGTSLAEPASIIKFHTGAIGTKGAGEERLRITEGGLVGIGTQAPHAALEVSDSGVELRITDSRNGSFTAGDTVSSLGFYSDDTSGGSGGNTGLARGVIDVVSENAFGSSHAMAFKIRGDVTTAATEAMRIASSGHVIAPYGVTLGTAVGTYAAANTLDDYEEGTWTPVYTSSGGSFTTMTMDVLDASYTKIGNTVVLRGYIRTDDVDNTGATGSVTITGLPFTAAASASVDIGYVQDFNTNGHPDGAYISSSTIFLQERSTSDGGSGSLDVADLKNGTVANSNVLIFSAVYQTTS
jgi:hypothetical protein